jgi:hypothetical protein
MSKKDPQEVLGSMENFAVEELDDKDLEEVAGGVIENGNCYGCTGPVPGDPTNGNCHGCGPGSGGELE